LSAERQARVSPSENGQSRHEPRCWEQGATAIEYALVAAFIAGVIFVALVQLGESLSNLPFPALIAALTGAESP